MNPKKARTLTRVSVWFSSVTAVTALAVATAYASLTPPDLMQGLDTDTTIYIPDAVHQARDEERQRFQAAEEALRAGNRKRYELLSETLQDYPLYPYLELYDLQRRLFAATPEEMKDIRERYPDIPRTGWLYHQWLVHLGSSGNWALLREEHDGQSGGERLRCLALRAHLDGGDHDRIMNNMPDLWRTGHSLHSACDPLLDYWRNNQGLTSELAWERFMLALGAGNTGLASYLRRYMERQHRELSATALTLHRQPHRLRRVQDYTDPMGENPALNEVVVHAMHRMAGSNPERAADLWPQYRSRMKLSDGQRARVEQRLGLMLAVRYHEKAPEWLQSAMEVSEDPTLHEWLVRSHLRQGDWSQVARSINAMPEDQKERPRWQYWLARAHDETGDTQSAQRRYHQAAQSREYYGFMAADRLGAPYRLNHQGLSVSDEQLNNVTRRSGIQRAYELYQLGRLRTARQEWFRATNDLETNDMLAAARLAQSWGWEEKGVTGAIRAQAWDHLDMRFPLAYQEHFHKAAREQGLDVNWIYALARQESAFRPDAQSSKGARGILQLLPTTAQATAREYGMEWNGQNHLFDPVHNIQLGSAHLRSLVQDFDNNRILATAAYNAGKHRVKRWLENGGEDLPSDVWVETMPFYETRQYVQNVMAYTVVYGYRRGEPPTHLLTERELDCMCLSQLGE